MGFFIFHIHSLLHILGIHHAFVPGDIGTNIILPDDQLSFTHFRNLFGFIIDRCRLGIQMELSVIVEGNFNQFHISTGTGDKLEKEIKPCYLAFLKPYYQNNLVFLK
jgi:hypothetical protein